MCEIRVRAAISAARDGRPRRLLCETLDALGIGSDSQSRTDRYSRTAAEPSPASDIPYPDSRRSARGSSSGSTAPGSR